MASRNPRRIVFLIDQASLSLHYDQPQFVDQRKSFAIHIIQHACLKLLTFLGRSDFNGSFSWGYTFFNSLGFSVKQAEKRGFRIFSADTVNEFRCAVESNIIKYDTDIKCKEEGIAHSENISSKMFNVTEGKTTANVLHYALKNVLCDFQWDTPDIISPVKYKGNRKYCEECPKENYIFVISVCPLSVQEVQRFCGQKLQISSGPRKLLDSFLPKALFSVLRNEAKVRLFWLDTSVLLFKKELSTKENEDYEDDPSFGINLMHKSLSFVDGGVIPLQAFSPSSHLHPTCSVYNQCIYRDEIEGKGYWNPHCSLILPITTVAAFYLGRDKNQREQLNSATKSKTVSLILNSGSQRPLFWKLNIVKQELVNIRLCNLPKKEFVCMNTKDVGFQPELSMETCVSLPYTTGLFQWNIITVKRLVPRNTKLLLSVGKCIFLCYPVSDCSTEQQTSFSSLMVELATCGQILLVECTEESDNRVSVCGVLCPLTSSSATLSILSPVDTDTMYKQTCSIFAKQEESLSQFGDQEDTTCEQFQNFQSSSLESWFPSQPIDLELQEKLSGCRDVTREDSKMLQALQILYRPKYPSLKGSSWKVKEKAKSEQATFCEVRRSPRLRKCRSVTLNVSLRSANMVHKSVNTQKRNISTKYKQLGDVEFCKSSQKIQEVAKGQSDKKQIISSTDLTGQGFTDENQLVSHLKEVYNMAIEGETSLLSSVQTLVNLVLYFVKDKKQFEVAARELMDKHFLLSAKQINTKYEENLEPGAKNKRIKEYKIQALFALEMEAAMPSESTVEETVKKIVGLLRTMSFLSGPSVLNEFLLETVKDNYSHNLKDILLELGDELNIPIFPELCSPEKPLNNQSKFLGEDLFPEKYVPDSVSSGSTDSVTSRHERSSTNVMKHPSLMDLKQTRQIVVNKYKTKENSRKRTRDKSTLKSSSRRFSPRVSAKKASPHVPKTSPKKEVKQVCRNLFDTTKHFRKYSCPVQVSRKYNQKSEVTTPRGNNVLKTRFVPETPSHRQGPHVVLRKQEHLRSSTLTLLNAVVVEESPDKVLKEAEPLLNQRRPFQGLRRSCSFYDTETSKSRNMEKADASLLAQRIHGCSNVSPHTLFSELCSSPKVCMTSLQDIQMMSSNLKIHRVSSYNHKTPTGNMSTPRTRGTLSRSVLTTPTRKMSSAPRTPEASSSSILKTPSRKMSSAPRTSGASSSILKTPSRKMSSSPRTSGASSSILKTPSRKMSSSPRTSGASSSILKTPSKKPTSSPKTLGTFPSILKTPSKKLSSSPKTPGTSPPILMTLNRKMSSASRTPRVSPSIMKTSLSLWGSPSQNTRSKTPAKQSFSSLKHPSTPTSSTKIQRRILFKDGDSSDSGILSSHSSISPEIKKTPRCFKEGISLDATEIKTHDNEVHCTPKVILTNLNHIHSEDLSLDKEEYKLSELVPVEENIDHGSGEVNKNVKECTFRTNNNKIHEDLSLKFPRFTRGKSKEMGVSSDFFTILTTKSPTYQHPQEKTSSSPYKASLSCTEKLQNKLSKADMFGLRKRGSVDECTTRPLQKRRRTEANSRTKSEISLPTNTVGEEVKADEVFLVSPFNKTRDPSQNLDMKGVTPRHNMKQNYTPPSALSLLHLTTSPVVLRETNYMSDCKKDHETGTCKARRSLCNKLHR